MGTRHGSVLWHFAGIGAGRFRLMLGGEMDGAMCIAYGDEKKKLGGSIYPYRACMF